MDGECWSGGIVKAGVVKIVGGEGGGELGGVEGVDEEEEEEEEQKKEGEFEE